MFKTRLLLCVVLLTGCGGSDDEGSDLRGLTVRKVGEVCDPGSPMTCAGENGCAGETVCKADGSGAEECICESGSGGSAGTGGSSGEPTLADCEQGGHDCGGGFLAMICPASRMPDVCFGDPATACCTGHIHTGN